MPFFMYPHFRANLFDVSPPSTPMEKKVSDHTNSFSGTSLQLTFTLELNAIKCTTAIAMVLYPSFIYSCSISHILENEFFCFGRLVGYGWKKIANLFWKVGYSTILICVSRKKLHTHSTYKPENSKWQKWEAFGLNVFHFNRINGQTEKLLKYHSSATTFLVRK